MIKPINPKDEIDSELIHKMTRECMNVNYIKDFFTKIDPEIFLVIITEKMVIIMKATWEREFHYIDIVKKIYDILDIDENESVLILHATTSRNSKEFFINYEHCENRYYSYMDEIYNCFKSIIKKTGSEVNCAHIGLPQKTVEKRYNDTHFLPGVSIMQMIEYLKEQEDLCDWYRKNVVTIIDRDGEIFTVQREKIKQDKNGDFLYDDEIIQDKKNFLLHGGLRSALMIEIQKNNPQKYNQYKGRLIEGREALLEFGKNGFVVIWPYDPQDIDNYFGKGKHLYSESNTYINLPIDPTKEQINRLRELVSVLIYNPYVKEINAYQCNTNCNWDFINTYKRERNGRMSKDFLDYLDNYNKIRE